MTKIWIVTVYKKKEKEILESFPHLDEKKARSLFNALCTTSVKEISNPCMIHKTENEFIYANLLEERWYKLNEYII